MRNRRALLGLALLLACSESSPGVDGPPIADTSLDLARVDRGTDLRAKEARPADAAPGDLSLDGLGLSGVTCATSPPASATLASAPPSYSGGTCPTLVGGANSITSKGHARKFLLVLPVNPAPQAGEKFPVLFMWHWLKGSASSFFKKGEVQQAVDQQRFIAVIPESKGDLDLFGLIELPWPFTVYLTNARMDEEYAFFDDMLACVSQQQSVNKECVSTIGVSAGALFSDQLAAARSQYLASFVSLSGGVGSAGLVNSFVRPWTQPSHKLPAFVLWGGPTDSCILLNFQLASYQLEKDLIADSHFFVECIHNCGHGEPPVTPPAGQSQYAPIWQFVLAHPFWLGAGQSPWAKTGLPSGYISWCGIGKGSAKIRTGTCDPPGCPL